MTKLLACSCAFIISYQVYRKLLASEDDMATMPYSGLFYLCSSKPTLLWKVADASLIPRPRH